LKGYFPCCSSEEASYAHALLRCRNSTAPLCRRILGCSTVVADHCFACSRHGGSDRKREPMDVGRTARTGRGASIPACAVWCESWRCRRCASTQQYSLGSDGAGLDTSG